MNRREFMRVMAAVAAGMGALKGTAPAMGRMDLQQATIELNSAADMGPLLYVCTYGAGDYWVGNVVEVMANGYTFIDGRPAGSINDDKFAFAARHRFTWHEGPGASMGPEKRFDGNIRLVGQWDQVTIGQYGFSIEG